MKLKEYLHKQNVRASDVGKVLITFKFAAYSTWIILVPLCGKLQPIRRFSRMSAPRRLKAAFIRRYPNKYESWEEHIIKGSEWFAKRKSVRWIPDAFGQKHKDFGLSVAEATVLYKILFPIWAPLEFMYIVRFYKKKWGVSDMIPTPKSIDEYTSSYKQASEVNVLSFSSKIDHNDNDDDDDDDDDDNRNNEKGSGTGASGTRNRKNITKNMSIHTCSSSLSHLIGLWMHRRSFEKEWKGTMQWNELMHIHRYGVNQSLRNVLYCSNMISLL